MSRKRVEIVAITLDDDTKNKLDKYGYDHGLSRSAVIRLAVNEFFIHNGLNWNKEENLDV